ncbi:hypothetical protein MMC24_004600 [Lignoscripta atroalba]|nr:hypothetical protein [Lignoscripta atroalba]
MRLPNAFVGRGKQVLHALQALLVFVAWAVTIAIFTQPDSTGSPTTFYFILCWFSVPAFIFLTAIPAFARTKRFANPYALAAVDILFTILWFAALIAVAVWTNSGIKAGEAKKNDEDAKGCSAFGYGPEKTCKLSRVTVNLGVIIFLLFLATSLISAYNLIYYRKNGHLPNATPEFSDPTSNEAQKYAFSSNPNDEPEDHEDGLELGVSRPPRGRDNGGDEYALLHTETHPGRPLSWGREPPVGAVSHHDEVGYDAAHDPDGAYIPSHRVDGEQDTAYHGGGAYDPPRSSQPHRPVDPFRDPTHAPTLQYQPSDPFRYDLSSSHEHGSYGDDDRVNFPHADYTR